MAVNFMDVYDTVVRKEYPAPKPEPKEDELFTPDDEAPAEPAGQAVPEVDLNALADLIIEKMKAKESAADDAGEGGNTDE